MSSLLQKEVKCSCGEVFEAEIYQSISAKEDPELKDMLRGGRFNIVQCPSCHQVVYAEHFVLYHDSAQELLAFVYPKKMEAQIDQIQAAMKSSFEQLQKATPAAERVRYQPFLLFGLDALCDLLNIEDDIADEMKVVQALCDSMDLAYRKIHYDAARRNNVPAIFPIDARPAKGAKPAATLPMALVGLRKILQSNPYLSHYQRLLKKMEDGWFPQSGDFI